FQSHLSLTLPTSTGPAGFGRGTIAIALLHTYRAPLDSAVTFEGSLGTGYTPKHGPLARYQRTVFLSATSGARIRLWGGQSVYVNLFFHTPYYRDTRLRSLDGRDLTINFGALFRRRDGSEWRLGMSEDLFPSGPGVDLVLQVGRSF
ncbi:MAG TPA: hypothetical protein VNK43_11655, partial [Gemmatimonadales bacterium]|nr:hypothetical protein [Gemmatimonadales bacterium]